MKENLDKVEKFFKANLNIKRNIYNSFPKEEYSYEDMAVEYSRILYNSLKDMKSDMFDIAENFLDEEQRIVVKELFEKYDEKLLNCRLDYFSLRDYYNKYIGGMNDELLKEVGSNTFGYYNLSEGFNYVKDAKTVNELLHVIHHTITNDEKIYQNMPKISEKFNLYGEAITLYGEETELSRALYEGFTFESDVDCTDIVSFAKSKKIIMMVRGRGHAVSIEIDSNPEDDFITYYIPKICNVDMVNKLKGLDNPVTENSNYARGRFRTNREDTALQVIDLINKVPDDSYMQHNRNNELESMLKEEVILEDTGFSK